MAIVTLLVTSLPVAAQQSTLEQHILPVDCSRPTGCDTQPPSIVHIDKNGGRPIIAGTFDAIYTRILRITFGGRMYQLGIDTELTATGNEWRLELSALEPPLSRGGYVILVEATGYNDTVKTASRIIFFVFDDIVDDPGDPSPIADDKDGEDGGAGPVIPGEADRPTPNFPNKEILKELLLPAALVLATGAGLFMWPAFMARRARHEK